MQWLLLLSGSALGLYAFLRWAQQVGPARAAQMLRWLAVGAALILAVWLMARGGNLLLATLPLALPLLDRVRAILTLLGQLQSRFSQYQPSGGAAPGSQSSTVRTRFLEMSLDHLTKAMQGRVLDGRFQGRYLDDLTLSELLELWQECRSDTQSVAVLETWLDRYHPDWREQQQRERESVAPGQPMSTEEAYQTLGLQPGASAEEIRAAHRRLMQRVHPDHGGSDYLAARVNLAKKVLLGE